MSANVKGNLVIGGYTELGKFETADAPSPIAGAMYYDLTDNKYKISEDGSTWIDMGAGSGGGANTTLSNLDSPTAINQDLLPDGDGNYALGSDTSRYAAIHGFTVRANESDYFDANNDLIIGRIQGASGPTTPSGASPGFAARTQVLGYPLNVFTINATGSNESDNINIETGNTFDGNSGNISIRPGTVNGAGIRGHINANDSLIKSVLDPVDDQDAATKAYVDDAISGVTGFANTTLSNLTSPTSFNQDLLPSANNTRTVGSASLRLSEVHVSSIYGENAMGLLMNGNNLELVSNDDGLVRSANIASDMEIRSGQNGNVILNSPIPEDGPRGYVDFSGTLAKNIQNPVDPQDAATKDYVDNAVPTIIPEFSDAEFRIQDNSDATKELAFEVSSIATATTRTITMPNSNVDLGNIANAATLSGVSLGATNLGSFTGAIISDNETIKGALQDLESFIESLPNPITYQGTWSAATNTPTLSNSDVGVSGHLYRVTAAGTVDFGAGPETFDIGDSVVNNGTIWEKWDHSDAVISVNGQTGAVQLDAVDIPFDNTNIGISATDVQDALDEIYNAIPFQNANRTLSNLEAPTAINQSLLPDSDGSYDLGSDSERYSIIHGYTVRLNESDYFDIDTSTIIGRIQANSGPSTPSGADGGFSFRNQIAGVNVNIFSVNTTSANSDAIRIESGNTVDGNSGNISLRPGVPSGAGVRGVIDATSSLISNVADPVSNQDAATKAYVDANVGSGGYSVNLETTNFNAVNGETYLVNTTGGAVTVTLPTATLNHYVIIKDHKGTADVNNIILTGGTIDGVSGLTISSPYKSTVLVGDGTEWSIL